MRERDRRSPAPPKRLFPLGAGIAFGLALGGFFDGIVLHPLLQWHHMPSRRCPPTTLANLRINTRWDGLSHRATYLVVGGPSLRWRTAQKSRLDLSRGPMPGALLTGGGIFNVVEGLVDQPLLGIHHGNETVARSQWAAWDMGFICWGACRFVGGAALVRRGARDSGRVRGRAAK